ncbi:MAG: MASE1 domain-containing protein, partial [Burkholderiales bacterium]|nr:MASE1 domain-containing protein [Burkholderiales bacterium]
MGRLRTAPHAPLLTQAAAALLCMAVALATEQPAPGQEATQLFQPASGLVLALIVCGGRRLAPALGAGLLLQAALAGHAPLAALAHALGPVVAALVAAWLLRGGGRFDIDQPNFHVVGHVLLWACGVGAGTGALASTSTLVLAGTLAPEVWLFQCLQHWMGNALGILLVTPLVLAWRRTLRFPAPLRRVHEGLLVWTLTAAAAVAVFGNTVSPTLAPLANAYWMFLFVAWSGARLGLLSTMGLLCLIALQALWGTYQRTGLFARDIAASQGFGYWSYMMILGVVGLALAAWLTERRRQKTALRIAAIAFECQEGLLITDAQGRVVQANTAFERLTGHEIGRLRGHRPELLTVCSAHEPPPQPLSFTPPGPRQYRVRLQRRDGTTLPVWLTVSPVEHAQGIISHYVISLADITSLEEQEQRMAEHAATQRHALVREVHHRIKNNLQGIVGMLRTLDRQHPQLRGAIQQVVDQIQSIAAIHGLQGRAPS